MKAYKRTNDLVCRKLMKKRMKENLTNDIMNKVEWGVNDLYRMIRFRRRNRPDSLLPDHWTQQDYLFSEAIEWIDAEENAAQTHVRIYFKLKDFTEMKRHLNLSWAVITKHFEGALPCGSVSLKERVQQKYRDS